MVEVCACWRRWVWGVYLGVGVSMSRCTGGSNIGSKHHDYAARGKATLISLLFECVTLSKERLLMTIIIFHHLVFGHCVNSLVIFWAVVFLKRILCVGGEVLDSLNSLQFDMFFPWKFVIIWRVLELEKGKIIWFFPIS